jgi:hypothetical protein
MPQSLLFGCSEKPGAPQTSDCFRNLEARTRQLSGVDSTELRHYLAESTSTKPGERTIDHHGALRRRRDDHAEVREVRYAEKTMHFVVRAVQLAFYTLLLICTGPGAPSARRHAGPY